MPDGNSGIMYLSRYQSCPVKTLFKYVKFFQVKMSLDLTPTYTLDKLRALQAQDDKCTTLTRMLENDKLDPVAYSLHEGILYR